MSSLKLKGSTSGDVTITVPAQAGTNTVTIPAVTGTLPLSNLDHVTNRPNAKPLIINGGMTVAQRGTSHTGHTGSAYTLDRMYVRMSGAGTWTITQDTDVPSGYGFGKSLKMDCTSANASLDAGDFIFLNIRFEKQDMQVIKKGTSNAEIVTVAAWVKSPKTGTHVVSLYDANSSTNRYCMQTYTISSANTWQKIVVNFPADTGGDVMGTDNTHGMNLQFWFAAGSNFTSGSAATAWENYTAANQAVGQVNCSDSTANNILITGIQMEIGEYNSDTIPEFQHESFSDSLQRCQRYYEKSYNATTDPATSTLVGIRHGSGVAGQTGTGEIAMGIYFLTPKRTTPTITLYDRLGNSGKCSRADLGTAEHTNSTASAVHTGENAFAVSSGSGSAGSAMHCHFEAAAEL